MELDRETRALRHAALGDAVRLAIVDELAMADRSPMELRHRLVLESNLLAHHLDVLESAGLIRRTRSQGDRRRRYAQLVPEALDDLGRRPSRRPTEALFVCTQNSARSQLAAALWTQATGRPGSSAGTRPAATVHAGAVRAARRQGLEIGNEVPRSLKSLRSLPPLVVTVCDHAHEQLDPPPSWLHWSIPDPVPVGTAAAFDATVRDLRRRITALAGEP